MDHAKVIDIQILYTEERISNIILNYAKIYSNGKKEVCRDNVKYLDRYDECEATGSIVSTICLGQVYCGALRNDTRLLFLAKKEDGSVQLLQERAGSCDCQRLLELT